MARSRTKVASTSRQCSSTRTPTSTSIPRWLATNHACSSRSFRGAATCWPRRVNSVWSSTATTRKQDGSSGTSVNAEATVQVVVGGTVYHTAATGNGPVNALDAALRKALSPRFPGLRGVTLHDYKVRILDGDAGTAATTRVLIESGKGLKRWTTVGCSSNIIEASLLALVDALEYAQRT